MKFHLSKLLFIIIAICVSVLRAGGVTVDVKSLSGLQTIAIEADASTGLKQIIVVDNARGATVTFGGAAGMVSAYSFGSAGAAYATPITGQQGGGSYSVELPQGDCGLTFEVAGDRAYHYWIVDYSIHRLKLEGLSIDAGESDCSIAALRFEGEAGPINYYTINGAPKVLSRDIKLGYRTLKYDADRQQYIEAAAEKTFASLSTIIHADQPLCATSFTLSGDRFTTAWGEREQIESPVMEPTAVEAHATMNRLDSIADNMTNSGTDNGPAELNFEATVTDAVRFIEWQTSAYSDFSIIDLRFNRPDFDIEISESGVTYIRLVVANDTGDCQWTSETFEVNIGGSKLLCPNAFSPGDQNGVNDEWKVSYSSLTEFECNIFNRWGVHIIKLTDPSQGWDGRYRGKLVESGVYYYVIKAHGTDGVDYKLAGDINVINYSVRKNPTSQQ